MLSLGSSAETVTVAQTRTKPKTTIFSIINFYVGELSQLTGPILLYLKYFIESVFN